MEDRVWIALIFLEYKKNNCTLEHIRQIYQKLVYIVEDTEYQDLIVLRTNVLAVLKNDTGEQNDLSDWLNLLEERARSVETEGDYSSQIRCTGKSVLREDMEKFMEGEISLYEHDPSSGTGLSRMPFAAEPPAIAKEDPEDYTEIQRRLLRYIEKGDNDRVLVNAAQLYLKFRSSSIGSVSGPKLIGLLTSILLLKGNYSSEDAGKLLKEVSQLSLSATFYRFIRLELDKCCQLHEGSRYRDQKLPFMDKVRIYIDNDISNPDLDLKTAAEAFGLTPTYFSSLFTKNMQVNFNAYLTHRRMNLARALLSQQTGLTIERIANMCGYDNVGSFRRNFKAIYGENPGKIMPKS